MRTLSLILVAVLLSGTAGCQSFSSTMISRLDSNGLYGNSNGETKKHNKARPFKGVPITLKVPTHLDIYVDETYYMSLIDGRVLVDSLNDADSRGRILHVRAEVIETDKVFTVDFKRPGSGTLDLDLALNDQQYFDKITSKIVDTTITDVAALVAQVIDSAGAIAAKAATSASNLDELNEEERDALLRSHNILRDIRTVAYQRFDINAPDFEIQVQEFVDRHLNCCNQCGNDPTYDQLPSYDQAAFH